MGGIRKDRIRKEGIRELRRRGSARVATERRYVRRVMREDDRDTAPGGSLDFRALGLVRGKRYDNRSDEVTGNAVVWLCAMSVYRVSGWRRAHEKRATDL